MIANLYLHSESFKYNSVDTKEQVAKKISLLVSDMVNVVNDYKHDNRFKIPTSLFSICVYDTMTICEMAEYCLENDYKGVFYTMLSDTSDVYDKISIKELYEKCRYSKNEKEVNSIVVLNQPEDVNKVGESQPTIKKDYITFDDYKIVYNKQTWLHLRRQILGNHPGEPCEFVEECKEYFPSITFSENCKLSLCDNDYKYLEIIPRKIVYYLSCLNDKFVEIVKYHKKKSCDANSILEDFSGIYNLDQPGSIERNCTKDSIMTFDFVDDNKKSCKVLCENHLKISQVDSSYHGKSVNYSTFHPRIYFNYYCDGFNNHDILVGSIGKHL